MRSLEWLGDKLKFLDQTKLPDEELYIETDKYEIVADAIRRLSIRGAPAIGIAGGYAVALAAIKFNHLDDKLFVEKIISVINELKSTRPTAVNLFWALERMSNILNSSINHGKIFATEKLIEEAKKIHNEDIRMCEAIGKNGAALIPEAASILTHCNTGALATGGDGTAQNVILTAHNRGKKIKVFVDETRPLLQGARLTMWELMKHKIDVTLITDNTAAFLMQQKKIDLVLTGADRITKKGYTANKVGTYNLAVLAKMHGIPFYIAAPTSTIDMSIEDGSQIVIEERDAKEVTEGFGKRIAPKDVKVYSPAFDITPPELITGIITELKIFYPPFLDSLIETLSDKLN